MQDKELQPHVDVNSLGFQDAPAVIPEAILEAETTQPTGEKQLTTPKIRRYSPEARARHSLRMRRVWRTSKGEDPNVPELADTQENIDRILYGIYFPEVDVSTETAGLTSPKNIIYIQSPASENIVEDSEEASQPNEGIDSDRELWEYAIENDLIKKITQLRLMTGEEINTLSIYFNEGRGAVKAKKLLDKFSILVARLA